MASKYYNLDGQEKQTSSWYFPGFGVLYSSLSAPSLIDQKYTAVTRDIPEAIDTGSGEAYAYASYWGLSETGKTKRAVSQRFRLHTEPRTGTLRVFLNGEEITYSQPLADKRYFDLILESDGYLWASYLPGSVSLCAGDQRESFAGLSVETEIRGGKITVDNVVRARRAVNTIEDFMGIRPTVWSGGEDNLIRGKARNLFPGVTPVHILHLEELIYAVQRLETYVDAETDFEITRSVFSSFAENDPYMVEYIEQILAAINNVESLIINHISG